MYRRSSRYDYVTIYNDIITRYNYAICFFLFYFFLQMKKAELAIDYTTEITAPFGMKTAFSSTYILILCITSAVAV